MSGTIKRKLVLANGMEFIGQGFGSEKDVITEVVFNTSVVGYQEIMSDNSYCDQAIVMTFPLIGNYGVNLDDFESVAPACDALIVSEWTQHYSHYEATKSIDEFLKQHQIVGLSHIDTRQLTQVLRDYGSQLGMICDYDTNKDEAVAKINAYVLPEDQVSRVSTKKAYRYENTGYRIVALDFGIKLNILRKLHQLGFDVTVLPHDSTVETVMSYQPDGLFLSNGPGDPRSLPSVIETIKELQSQLPIFGICLGHQLIGLANNCTIEKLKFGHRGGNHPVKNMQTNKIEITSQNHSYAIAQIDESQVEVTHRNMLDQTIEGLHLKHYPVMSVQYHPESAPGPEDSHYLFEQFYQLIKESKGGNVNA